MVKLSAVAAHRGVAVWVIRVLPSLTALRDCTGRIVAEASPTLPHCYQKALRP